MELKFENLLVQIYSLIEMYKIDTLGSARGDTEKEAHEKQPEKRRVGRPRKFDTHTEMKEYHQAKLRDEKYSTKYYKENKCRVPCQYCNKEINNLAKTSHYKSKHCLSFRDEPRILTSRIS